MLIITCHTDHTSQICSISRFKFNTLPEITLKRHFNSTDLDNLKCILSNKNWDALHSSSDVETAYNIFQRVLQVSLDVTFPRKKTKRKNKMTGVCFDNEAKSFKDTFWKALLEYKMSETPKAKRLWWKGKRTMTRNLELYDKMQITSLNLLTTKAKLYGV
uniref:Uncharacterized protein n=1 Tax=Cuerna arida TaxID=1464854 RepID=A0A1B6FVT5_9HEMI